MLTCSRWRNRFLGPMQHCLFGLTGSLLHKYTVFYVFMCPPLPLLPVACNGTSQDGTDEGSIVSDDRRRRDVTGGDDIDDGANTSAECKDEDDHTPFPSQSSEHAVCMNMKEIAILCGMCPHTWPVSS